MFAKLFVISALVAVAMAGVLKDVTGGTFDLTTGQYSSAITGRVYNTAPVAPVAYAAHVAAPVASYVAPVATYAAAYGHPLPYAYGGYYF